jgi:hypothetical protein
MRRVHVSVAGWAATGTSAAVACGVSWLVRGQWWRRGLQGQGGWGARAARERGAAAGLAGVARPVVLACMRMESTVLSHKVRIGRGRGRGGAALRDATVEVSCRPCCAARGVAAARLVPRGGLGADRGKRSWSRGCHDSRSVASCCRMQRRFLLGRSGSSARHAAARRSPHTEGPHVQWAWQPARRGSGPRAGASGWATSLPRRTSAPPLSTATPSAELAAYAPTARGSRALYAAAP